MNDMINLKSPMLIEIDGDVWLLSDIICIALDEPSDDEQWAVSIKLRGSPNGDWEYYDMDSRGQAQTKHEELLTAWSRWLSSGVPV